MYLRPTVLHLGHDNIWKQLIKVILILDKSLLVHFEKLWSSRLLNINLFKMLEATTTPSRPQPVVTAHSDHVTEESKRSHLHLMQWNDKRKISGQMYTDQGNWWGKEREKKNCLNKTQKQTKTQSILKNCTCKHHTFTESKTRGEKYKASHRFTVQPPAQSYSLWSVQERQQLK